MLGAGDAMIFTSLLRVVAVWFRVKQAPFVTQLTGMVGQVGGIAAATPLARPRRVGVDASFATAAGIGVVLAGCPPAPREGLAVPRAGGGADQDARPHEDAR